MSREGTGVSPDPDPMPCIVCGIRPAADGSVCLECSAVLKSAVTGTVAPVISPAGFDKVDEVSESPTSPELAPTSWPSPSSAPSSAGREEEVRHRYAVGEELDARYTIVEEIGAGGMGVVYKALDRKLEKTVALKLMRPKAMEPANVARFRRELALAQRVSHPNVCRLHDLGEVGGVLYISMEHVEGQRLDHLIVSMGRLSPRQTVALGRQLCAGLRAIHEQGIIHRDLKPSNVMVNRSGHVFIMDFGLAVRPGRDKVTSTGAVLGTFAYLSPEQARGLEIGPRSDVYAAGLILYEMLTGVTPPGDEVALPLALRDAREVCPPPGDLADDVPAELDRLVMRCLERDPGKRFASAEELEAALAEIQGVVGSTTGRIHGRSSLRLWRLAPRSGGLRWALALAVPLAVAAVATRAWLSRPPAPRPIVAIVPLTNLSSDSSFDHLGVGLADVLMAHLAASPDITVVAAPGGPRGPSDLRTVAKELGASHVLSGSLQAGQGRIRVVLSLLRTHDSIVVGVGEGESELANIFDLPARMAERVTSAMNVELSQGNRQRLARAPTDDLRAFTQYSEAKALLQQRDVPGNVESAIALLESATGRDPKFALAYAALGEAYWTRFRESKDVAWANRANGPILQALRLDPEQPQVRLSLALVLQATGRLGEASEELRHVLSSQPGNDEAHRVLSLVLAERGEVGAALGEARKAVALRPDYWQHHSTLGGILYRASRYEEAARAYEEVVRLRPDSDRGYLQLGGTHLALGDVDLALKNFERAHRIAPSASTYANMAVVHDWRGDHQAAAAGYRKAIELRPNEPIYHVNLADAERRLGSGRARQAYERAVELLQELLALKPTDAPARALLAVCELELDRREAARANVEEALRNAPGNAEVLYRAATVYAGAGQPDKAMARLREALAGGYSPTYAERSEGLAPLKSLPEYKALMDEARAREDRSTH